MITAVGSHLREQLLSKGHHSVACMDNPKTCTLENVAHLQDEPNFEYMDHDASSYMNVPASWMRSTASPPP